MKIVHLATRRRVTIAMFTVAILLFGTVSLSRLDVNLLPDLTYPTLTVRTGYAGAAPVEIEHLLTKPIEEALGVVKNVEQLRSVSRTGQSDVVLEFAWGTNMDRATLEVREQLDALTLPLESERPMLLRFDPSLDPIIRLGLYQEAPDPQQAGHSLASHATLPSGDAASPYDESTLRELRRFADEELKKELEATAGVAAAKISGGLEDEIQVAVDQARLAQLGITLSQVSSVLDAENVNRSGGRLEEGVYQYLVRTLNEFETIEEIGNVIVTQVAGTPVYLRDVADVRLGHKERESITRIDGTEAVEIAVYKEGDANTVAVAHAVDQRLERLRASLPDRTELSKVYDQSIFIGQAVNEVVRAGIIGGLLAILILYFFLRDFASTLIISLSIPVSVIATFNLMYGFDLTLNIMSLGGLALGIGLLVDNSIVVLENIARHRSLGKSRGDAARAGAGEVGRAVIASTLTTVAVFFPLVFVEGVAGQLFSDQALTVTFALLASLLVAITLIPMLASFGERREPDAWTGSGRPIREGGNLHVQEDSLARPESAPHPQEAATHSILGHPHLREPRTRIGRWLRWLRLAIFTHVPTFVGRCIYRLVHWVSLAARLLFSPFVRFFNGIYDALAGPYPSLLHWGLRHRGMVLTAAFGLFACSLLLIPRLGMELIPPLVQGAYNVEFRLPPGTPLERTDAVLERVQRQATDIPGVRLTFASAGSGNRMDANPDQGGENWGELHVALDVADDQATEARTMTALRSELGRVPGLDYKFDRPTLFTFETPVEIEISGYDLDALETVSKDLVARLDASERFADVKSSMERGHPELRIHFDRERASALGLPVHQIAERVVSKVRGDVATRYSRHDRKIDVLVRTRESDRASIDQIKRLIINPESPRPVPLEAVADIITDIGPGEIRRVGQQRVALVTANLNHGDLGTAAEEIRSFIAEVSMPTGISARLTGQSEEMSASFRSLLLALALAIFLVYLVMASQFESLLHPFIIFFTIPLAGIGALWALWLTGNTISVVAYIGLILLAGIVVNNAIVLVDLINQLRSDGMRRLDAIVEAGRLRLRPILMTTLTTALGLLPMAIGWGEGAELRAPMAITVIGGLLVSTLLTLLVIPVTYSTLDRRP